MNDKRRKNYRRALDDTLEFYIISGLFNQITMKMNLLKEHFDKIGVDNILNDINEDCLKMVLNNLQYMDKKITSDILIENIINVLIDIIQITFHIDEPVKWSSALRKKLDKLKSKIREFDYMEKGEIY